MQTQQNKHAKHCTLTPEELKRLEELKREWGMTDRDIERDLPPLPKPPKQHSKAPTQRRLFDPLR